MRNKIVQEGFTNSVILSEDPASGEVGVDLAMIYSDLNEPL